MCNLKIMRNNLHIKYLHIRNCNNLVQSDNFKIAYDLANEEERKELKNIVETLDKEGIKNFITTKIMQAAPFEQLNMRKLREIGQYLSIENYHILNKFSLVEEINRVAKALKENSKRKYF